MNSYVVIGGSELQSKCLRLQLGQLIASPGWDTLWKRTAQAQSLKPSHVYIAGYCLKHSLQSVPSAACSPWKAASGAACSQQCLSYLQYWLSQASHRMGALGVLIHGCFLIYLWQMQSLLLHLSVSLPVVTTTLKSVGRCSAFRCSIQSGAYWFGQALISVCVNTPGQGPRQQRAD